MAKLEVIDMEMFIKLLTACAPILVALIALIPTIKSGNKKTREKNE